MLTSLAFTLAIGYALLQYLSNDLLLPDYLRQKYGNLFEYNSDGSLRLSGLFSSKARFGEAVVFSILIIYQRVFDNRQRALSILLLLLLLFLLANSYSRSGYLLAIICSTLFFSFKLWVIPVSYVKKALFLSCLVGASFMSTFHFIKYDSASVLNITALDTASIISRFQHWGILLENFSLYTPVQLLLGTGCSAFFPRSNINYFVIDNLYLALFNFGGLFGLLSFALLIFYFFKSTRDFKANINILTMRIFLIGLLFSGILLDNHNTVFLLIFSGMGLSNYLKWKAELLDSG